MADAVEFAAGKRLRYGDRLDDLIGEENATEFICHAMEIASTGLAARRSRRVIVDEIKADLHRYFEKAGLAIFDIAARHAACGYDLAVTICEALEQIGSAGSEAWIAKFAARASAWEPRADHLLNEARDDIKRYERGPALLRFFESADDAVDELEDAASLVELMALTPSANVPFAGLRALARRRAGRLAGTG